MVCCRCPRTKCKHINVSANQTAFACCRLSENHFRVTNWDCSPQEVNVFEKMYLTHSHARKHTHTYYCIPPQEVGGTLIREDDLVVKAGAEPVEWYQIHPNTWFLCF